MINAAGAGEDFFMRKFLSILLVAFFIVNGSCMTVSQTRNISPEEGKAKVKAGALLLDVRTPEEFQQGHVEGAINIPYDKLADRLSELGEDKSREIVTYCQAGRRAEVAQQTLSKSGYQNAFSAGGYPKWIEKK